MAIISLTSFMLVLNASRCLLDHLLYCGILGEILVGIIWGLPLGDTSWLSAAVQNTMQNLGYLGLIALVFEGGLSTSVTQLRSTALMSVTVATIGLCLPIALSFVLLFFPFPGQHGSTTHPSPLAAFSAGASLCSTSLGTTFAILSAAGLQSTRLGVILVGAAMMDDVVGLVMVKIVTALGSGSFAGWEIARPIVASFSLLIVTLAATTWMFQPIARRMFHWLRLLNESSNNDGRLRMAVVYLKKVVLDSQHISFVMVTFILLVLVSIAAFIDASILFAAFIAGGLARTLCESRENTESSPSFLMDIYDYYYRPVVKNVLAPFFFVSSF